MSDPTPTPTSGGFLDKKISGIKAQYLIIFGLAVALGAYYWRKRKGAATPIIPTVVDTSGQTGGFPTSGGGGGGGSTVSAPVQQTNAQWARGALNAAIGNGSVDATDGANAVTAWLNGQTLTASQTTIIAKLTTAYGQPPEGVLPIGPGTPTPTDNVPVRYIRNSAGSISAQAANGTTYPITYAEWVALGNQGAQYVQVTDTEYAGATAKK